MLFTAKKVSIFGVILVHIFPSFSRIRTEYGEIMRIQLRIRTIFTQLFINVLQTQVSFIVFVNMLFKMFEFKVFC